MKFLKVVLSFAKIVQKNIFFWYLKICILNYFNVLYLILYVLININLKKRLENWNMLSVNIIWKSTKEDYNI